MIRVFVSDPQNLSKKCYLWDPNLTFRAKGMLELILSLPTDIQISEDLLLEASSKDGKFAIRAALKELISKGYIIRNQSRDEAGRLDEMVYLVYPETFQKYRCQQQRSEVH